MLNGKGFLAYFLAILPYLTFHIKVCYNGYVDGNLSVCRVGRREKGPLDGNMINRQSRQAGTGAPPSLKRVDGTSCQPIPPKGGFVPRPTQLRSFFNNFFRNSGVSCADGGAHRLKPSQLPIPGQE